MYTNYTEVQRYHLRYTGVLKKGLNTEFWIYLFS